MAGRDVRDGIESLRHSRINFAQYSAQVVAQFADFLIAVFWILSQRPIQDHLQTWRHGTRSSFVQRLWLFMQHGVAHVDAGLSLKRPGAGEHLVKQHAGREDVRARIDAFAARLLRRGIGSRAVRNANFGEVGVMNSAWAGAFAIQKFRQAKVENLRLTRRRHHHVAGLDVAMNDAARVRRSQRVGDLDRDRKRAAQIQRPARDKLAHVLPVDELHRNKVDAADIVEIKNRADVWMIERGCEPRFALEPLEVGFLGRQFRRQDLDHDRPAQLGVGRFVNCSLPTGANLFEDSVIPKFCADHFRVYLTPAARRLATGAVR